MKITEEIYQVGGSMLTASSDAAIYLVIFTEHAALIDAGTGRGEMQLLENISSVGTDPSEIELILVTHCHFDHTGGLKSLKQRLNCQVIAHELDAQFIEKGDNQVTAANWYNSKLQPCTVDHKLTKAEESIKLGERIITAVHTPGHSPGSVVYVTESEGLKVVFAQDVHGPLDPSFLSNRADYQNSLKRILDLKADILCEGHYGVFRGDSAIRDFILQFM